MNCNKNIIRIFLTVYIFFFVIFPFSHCHADCELIEVNAAKEFSIENIHPLFTDPHCCEFHANNHSHDKDHLHFLTEDSNITRLKNKLWKSDSKQTAAYSTPCILIASKITLFTVHTESEQFQQRFKQSFSGLSPPAV
jgi:hypothetical protein